MFLLTAFKAGTPCIDILVEFDDYIDMYIYKVGEFVMEDTTLTKEEAVREYRYRVLKGKNRKLAQLFRKYNIDLEKIQVDLH